MSHEVNFPDYLWRLAQQASGTRNPASWIRNRIGELLTDGIATSVTKTYPLNEVMAEVEATDDPLGALGIYAKTDRENFSRYSLIECGDDPNLAIKALASKDNPTAFLQWWADKQTEGS